jgi:hypothetical protein
VGFSGDWRDSGWGQVAFFGVIPTSAGAAVASDGGYQAEPRIVGAVLSVLFALLVLYAVLRVLKVLPVHRGRHSGTTPKGTS